MSYKNNNNLANDHLCTYIDQQNLSQMGYGNFDFILMDNQSHDSQEKTNYKLITAQILDGRVMIELHSSEDMFNCFIKTDKYHQFSDVFMIQKQMLFLMMMMIMIDVLGPLLWTGQAKWGIFNDH